MGAVEIQLEELIIWLTYLLVGEIDVTFQLGHLLRFEQVLLLQLLDRLSHLDGRFPVYVTLDLLSLDTILHEGVSLLLALLKLGKQLSGVE